MSKISVEIPGELLEDVEDHVGNEKKFVSTSDAIRSSLRKMLNQMDEVDKRKDRLEQETDED
jgi:Arc/MetJ-type ribon-helix-helix transcriptional regulator